jgi:hypothetical protein
VACYDWAVPLHKDQQSGPLDLKRDERLRSDLKARQEKKNGRNSGDGVQMSMVASTPAIFRGSEVVNGQQLLKVVTLVCSMTFFASRNDGDGRMELSNSGGTPASNYRQTGDL